MAKILSMNECMAAEEILKQFNTNMNSYFEAIQNILNKLRGSSIVQSFYASGPLGQQKERDMIDVANALKRLTDLVNTGPDSLYQTTTKYLTAQKSILERKSMAQRRIERFESTQQNTPVIKPSTIINNTPSTMPASSVSGYKINNSISSPRMEVR